MTLQKKRFDYKWVILAMAFLMVFVCLGFCSANKGLYLGAITEALDIERGLFSINDSCRFIATAIINLFFGALVGKFGIRKMLIFGFASLIGSMTIYATANNIFVFYIGGTLLGVGLTFTTTTMASTVVRRWFKKDIGKYTGIVFAANGIGGALAAQIVTPLIESGTFGYRKAYIVVACLLAVIGTLIAIFIREQPRGETAPAAAPAKKKARGAVWVGIEYKKVNKMAYFYLAGVIVFITGFALQGINGAFAAHLKDIGLSPEFVATVSSVYSLSLTGTKLLVGALYDRFGLRVVMLICQTSAVLAFISLALLTASLVAGAPTLAMILAFAFGFLYATALPLETLVIPLIVNDLFGSASFDKVLGLMMAMNYTGYALGGPVVNLCFDKFGTYAPALFALAGITIAALFVFQFVINSAYKQKNKILDAQEVQ